MYKTIKPLESSGKMYVTPEQSMHLQEHLFRIGYRWKNDGLRVLNIDRPHFIMWYDSKAIAWNLPYKSAINNKNTLHKFEEYFDYYFLL